MGKGSHGHGRRTRPVTYIPMTYIPMTHFFLVLIYLNYLRYLMNTVMVFLRLCEGRESRLLCDRLRTDRPFHNHVPPKRGPEPRGDRLSRPSFALPSTINPHFDWDSAG